MAKKKKNTEPKFILNTPEEIKQAREELETLKHNLGWKRIVKFLDEKIKYHEKQILDGEIKDMAELNLIRAKRDIVLQTRNLPDIIIESFNIEMAVPELDPYEKSA